MKKTSIVEAYVYLTDWFKSKFLSKSILYKPLKSFITKSYDKLSRKDVENSHFTFRKLTKGVIGFIPVAVSCYYLGYTFANKVNFNDFIRYLRSEDEIYSLLEKGRPVVTFMYLPGEVFSELTHPHFHKIAHENYQ